ncbi:MAG: Rpn family recombination-promoting nuclease/putative transposase [Acetatifactor sp.]|nr:Rpn family recombination-promoting nuclease/putative transposase [Acetatifactor sp.]
MNNRKNVLPPAEEPAAETVLTSQEDGISQAVKEKYNQHNRDISSKTVFGNAVLCAQFLRDNLNMPVLRDVQPEDIEDVSERYYPYLGTEFNSDSVKRIRILDIEKGKKDGRAEPAFLVSLIEHKSLVDYDVSMQLLRYMVCIWTEYRREMESRREGCTVQTGFRYPVIIPIVYYEGKHEWTADRRLGGRIRDSSEFPEWIPDFQYEVVRIHDYSDRELLNRGNEMSLIMLINKIQNTADLENFIRIPPDEINRIIQNSPKHVVEVLVTVMESLCFKMEVSDEERTQCVRKVKARDMGYLFENMEKISIQEERRKTEEQRKKTEEERRKTEEQRKKTEEQRKRAEEAEEKLRLAEEMIRQLQKSKT